MNTTEKGLKKMEGDGHPDDFNDVKPPRDEIDRSSSDGGGASISDTASNAAEAAEGRIFEYRWSIAASEPKASDESSECVGLYALVPLAARGRLLAVGGDELVHILQMSTETVVNEDGFLEGVVDEIPHSLRKVHTDSIATAAISDDGKYVALGGLDGRVSIYLVNSGVEPIVELQNVFEDASSDIEHITFAPSSSAVLATTRDGQAICWHALKGFVSLTSNHKGPVRSGRFVKIRNVPFMVTIGEDGYLCVSDPQNGQCRHRICVEKSEDPTMDMADLESARGIMSFDILDDQSSPVAICGCASGAVVIVNYEAGQVVKRLPSLKGAVEAVAFAPSESRQIFNDQYIAACDDAGIVAFTTLSCDSWRTQATFKEDTSVTHLKWTHPDIEGAKTEAKVVAAGTDGLIKIFDCRNGQVLDCLSTDERSICTLELIYWTKDLTIVACGTDDGSLLFWQLD